MFDETEHVIIGYGSLLSHDSRLRHSDIDCHSVPVSVSGFRRAWVTRSKGEKQTYVGAKSCTVSELNGVLLPVEEITEDLKVREQDYRFVSVELSRIAMHDELHREAFEDTLADKQIWLCESLYHDTADQEHPVYQSYIDTCLIGCLEAGGERFARQFVESTHFWEDHWVDDRSLPRYPRHARVTDTQQQEIDEVLGQCEILHYRKGMSD